MSGLREEKGKVSRATAAVAVMLSSSTLFVHISDSLFEASCLSSLLGLQFIINGPAAAAAAASSPSSSGPSPSERASERCPPSLPRLASPRRRAKHLKRLIHSGAVGHVQLLTRLRNLRGKLPPSVGYFCKKNGSLVRYEDSVFAPVSLARKKHRVCDQGEGNNLRRPTTNLYSRMPVLVCWNPV